MKNPDYVKMYKVFRMFPVIAFALMLIPLVIFGIVDAAGEWALGVAGLFVWPLVGVVAGAISWFITAVLISPIIIIVDSKLDNDEA